MAERTQPVRPATPETSTPTDMTTARFDLAAADFALAELFERVPDATVELEPAVANPDGHALLVVETEASRHDTDLALRESPDTAAVEAFGGDEQRWRYRVTWDGDTRRLIQQLVTTGVTLVGVHGTTGRWKLRLVAPERAAIARAYDVFEDRGCDFHCRSITAGEGTWPSHIGLSDKQRAALTKAFEVGYYDVPREATAQELAGDLDISHQALSERLRRAHRGLIADSHLID
jgi:predicted DNA binding protein